MNHVAAPVVQATIVQPVVQSIIAAANPVTQEVPTTIPMVATA
jgi:hypothetical protein